MKKNNKLKTLLLSIIVVFGLSIGLASEIVEASEGDTESVTVSVEKFSLGQGYIVEPIQVPFNEGDTADTVVKEVLGEGNYKLGPYGAFYLSSVYDPESSGTVDTIPQFILDMAGSIEANKDEWLGERDFTGFSGWTYFANNYFAPYGMDQHKLSDGDVIRVQFTVVFGDVTEQIANKDKLTKKVAEINSASNKAEILAKPGVQAAYNQAYTVLTNLESSQEQTDTVLAELTASIDADIEAPTISLGDVQTEQTLEFGADFTLPVLTATDNVDETVEVTTTIADASGNYLETLNTEVPGTYTITYSAEDQAGNQAEPVVLTVIVEEAVDKALERSEQLDRTMAYLLSTVPNPSFGTGAGEWTILALARSGYDIPTGYFDLYYDNIVKTVNELMPENERSAEGRLDRNKGSEHSRLIIGLTAIGKDVTDVGHDPLTGAGYNILEALADYDYMVWQGINGPIYALIALDSNNYEIPQVDEVEVQATRQMYLDYILEHEKDGGGWALFGAAGDVDITGMALQALAPYYNSNPEVKAAVDRAIAWLSSIQKDHGGFEGQWSGYSSESVSQVVIGLTGLGIDIENDVRFIKSGNTLLDALMTFSVPEGGFKHNHKYSVDGIATDQAAHALVAYQRLANGQNRLYNMSDVVFENTPEPEDGDLAELEAKIDKLLARLEALTNQNETIINQNSSLRQQIAELNENIIGLQAEVAGSTSEIVALEERLAELEKQVVNLGREIKDTENQDDNKEVDTDDESQDDDKVVDTDDESQEEDELINVGKNEVIETGDKQESLPRTGETNVSGE